MRTFLPRTQEEFSANLATKFGTRAHWDLATVGDIRGRLILAKRPPVQPGTILCRSRDAIRSAIHFVDSRVEPDLKWPNDLLIDGKKVCGILTEMNAEATRVRYIVVGIGINVNQDDFPKELAATSLRLATGKNGPGLNWWSLC